MWFTIQYPHLNHYHLMETKTLALIINPNSGLNYNAAMPGFNPKSRLKKKTMEGYSDYVNTSEKKEVLRHLIVSKELSSCGGSRNQAELATAPRAGHLAQAEQCRLLVPE